MDNDPNIKPALTKNAAKSKLRERTTWCKQQDILRLFGQIDYFPEYDYKATRRKIVSS